LRDPPEFWKICPWKFRFASEDPIRRINVTVWAVTSPFTALTVDVASTTKLPVVVMAMRRYPVELDAQTARNTPITVAFTDGMFRFPSVVPDTPAESTSVHPNGAKSTVCPELGEKFRVIRALLAAEFRMEFTSLLVTSLEDGNDDVANAKFTPVVASETTAESFPFAENPTEVVAESYNIPELGAESNV
jgi:hypothetical protein